MVYAQPRIGQNTKKSSGDLRRRAVTQTRAKDHQLKLMWKMNNYDNYWITEAEWIECKKWNKIKVIIISKA